MMPSERFWLKGKRHTQQRKIGLWLCAGIGVYALFLVVFGAG
jgi:hypothetical protein